eukprot:Tbor_TRINITY_DN3111_c0_g1::TRINITY_DN3111_c0_g1_i1::g.14700::m.14700
MADAKHGRRARGDDVVKSADTSMRVANEYNSTNNTDIEREAGDLPMLKTEGEEIDNIPRSEVDLSSEIAVAPTEYHTMMPQLADLNSSSVQGRWAQVLRPTADIDLSVLISALSSQLDDEDVTWNPEELLVQLNSDLLDASERRNEEGAMDKSLVANANELDTSTNANVGSLKGGRRRLLV